MLAATPPMGLNTWNTFGLNIDENLIRETADAMVETGLAAAGYDTLVIDDCWEATQRGSDGQLKADPDRFGSGIKTLANDVHNKDLKFGIYSCAGTLTCQKLPASFGYEQIDAATFAQWGCDYLKYDYCYVPAGAAGPELFKRMGQALRQTGRPIVYSICEWGTHQPWTWGASVGGHLWRTTEDIEDTWASIEHIGFSQHELHPYAGPGRWNDPDMLVVGMYGQGNVARDQHPTDTEYFTHFGLWCLLAAPLMIGCDVRNMNDITRAILLNKDLIAINQDPLGVQGFRVGKDRRAEVWAKPLADGSIAVGLFNRGDMRRNIAVSWETLGLPADVECKVRDCWAGEELGTFKAAFTSEVDSHGAMILLIG